MTVANAPPRSWKRRWKDGWVGDLDAPGARRAATIDMLVFDHGLLRLAWRNLHPVADGVWRGNQPDPPMVRRLARRGFRSILNLRGATEFGSYLLEREACRECGIALLDLKLSSDVLPSAATILALDALLRSAERPLLFHCKSGSDRAGFVAALYLLLQGAGPAAARAQLSWRYLHVRTRRTAVLHGFLDAVEAQPLPFRDWLQRRYDPVAITATDR